MSGGVCGSVTVVVDVGEVGGGFEDWWGWGGGQGGGVGGWLGVWWLGGVGWGEGV